MAVRKVYRKHKSNKKVKRVRKSSRNGTRKVNRKNNRRQKRTRHQKRSRRQTHNKRSRRQRRHFHRGGGDAAASPLPFDGAKPYDPVNGGNYYVLNQQAGSVDPPLPTRQGNIAVVQKGGRIRRRRPRVMRGGNNCPTCPNASGVGPAKPSLTGLVPPPLLKLWRGASDTVENINYGFKGEHLKTDDANIVDQPIGHNISGSPFKSDSSLNIQKIMNDSNASVANL